MMVGDTVHRVDAIVAPIEYQHRVKAKIPFSINKTAVDYLCLKRIVVKASSVLYKLAPAMHILFRLTTSTR
jgi:hypothetical protein